MTRKILLSKEEEDALLRHLKSSWVIPDDQKIIYNLINRIERERELEDEVKQ